jgi:hypothetical protein
MLFPAQKKFLIVSCWLIFFPLVHINAREVNSSLLAPVSSDVSDPKGYTDIVLFKDKLIAVGTHGRIDCISQSGERISIDSSYTHTLRCAFACEDMLITAGDKGTMMFSLDGKSFYRAESGTKNTIHSITVRNGLLIAAADSGTFLTSKDGKSWNKLSTSIKGNILSVSANNNFFFGVTDKGEILKSSDGLHWNIQDYNREYAGYNARIHFKKILATQHSIAIIGTHDDGSPSILFSSMGNVWAEREPIYKNEQGVVTCLTNKPNGITYDPERDQFILACDHGEMLTLPPCSKCNKFEKISETDFSALIYHDNCLWIVGDEFSVYIQK